MGLTENVFACDQMATDVLGLGVRIGMYLQYTALIILLLRGCFKTLKLHGYIASASALALMAVLADGVRYRELPAAVYAPSVGLMAMQLAIIFLSLPLKRLQHGLVTLTEPERGVLRPGAAARNFRRSLGYGDELQASAWNSDWHRLANGEVRQHLNSAARSEIAVLLMLLLLAMQAAGNVWFWNNGYEDLLPPEDLNCPAVKFTPLFLVIDISRSWLRVVALITSCVFLAIALWHLSMRLFLGLLQPESTKDLQVELGLPPFATVDSEEKSFAFTQSVTVELQGRLNEMRSIGVGGLALALFTGTWVFGIILAGSLLEFGMQENKLPQDVFNATIGQVLSVLLGVGTFVHSFTVSRVAAV